MLFFKAMKTKKFIKWSLWKLYTDNSGHLKCIYEKLYVLWRWLHIFKQIFYLKKIYFFDAVSTGFGIHQIKYLHTRDKTFLLSDKNTANWLIIIIVA